jgi:hypothetical protein
MRTEISGSWNSGALLGLVMLFLFGLFDAVVARRRDWACAIWFIAVLGVAAWVAYPLTALRIVAGASIFLLGLALLAAYYRNAPDRQIK